MKKISLSLISLLISGIFLSACGPGQVVSPTPTLTPDTSSTPTLAPVPTATLTSTATPLPAAASAVNLQCEDWALVNLGEFQAQNNTWGKGTLEGWSQCIGLGSNPDGSLAARWTWDWPKSGLSGVKAYPEIVFGQKPGGPTTSPSLPIQLQSLHSAKVDYDVSSSSTGRNNLAFDIWLTDSPNPDTWGVPPITHEVMIWIDGLDRMSAGGSWVEKTDIDGESYMVFVGENWGDGWTYIAFVSDDSLFGQGTLDVASFLQYMIKNNLATGEVYLASIELGNELVDGTGETILHRYEITIQ
jgi:serralysin